jgi:branched-chain amino acid transport system ATP-binding protein
VVVVTPLLQVRDLSLAFDGVVALDGVGFEVTPGELLALIGPNGAGKTSVFNLITGLYRPSRGRVVFDGRDVTGLKPHRIARRGVVRTFQGVEVFETMTVLDNLLLGRFNKSHVGVLAGAVWEGWAVRDEVRQRRKVEEVIDFLDLAALRHRQVGALPYGLQKRVELGRALAMEPRLLLLDEPVAGMNQEETEDMVRAILDVREELDITVVLVEHDMDVVMQISDRICVLDFGRVLAVGPPDEIAGDPAVRDAYLGLPAPGSSLAGGDGGRRREEDDVAEVVDLLASDIALPDVLAACAGLVPRHLGSAAAVSVVGGDAVVGAPAGSPAERLGKDDRWWQPTTTDGEDRTGPDFAGFPDDLAGQARAEGFRTVWTLPLRDATDDEVLGCLAIWVSDAVECTDATHRLLRPARRLANLAVRQERRHQALHREAVTDPLTGLGNRTALQQYLDAAEGPVTLAMIDLDGFKPVNDTYGHPTGDDVLRIVAQRVRRAVRDSDLVVRLGGDEFAIVFCDDATADRPNGTHGTHGSHGVYGLHGVRGVRSGAVPAERIVAAIEAPIHLSPFVELTVGASIGVATAPPSEAVERADAALYQAKRTKRPM